MKKVMHTLLFAMALTNPSGKQNSFAGNVAPDLVMVEFKKEKIALSYVNAFEVPVFVGQTKDGLVSKSIEKLVEHINNMDHAFNLSINHRAFFTQRYNGKPPKTCDVFDNLHSMAEACEVWLQEDELQ